MATMGAFWEKASIYLNLPKITMTDIVEILIITFLFYYMLVWIKNTRAWVLLKGIMVILLFVLVAAVFQMNTIIWIAKNTLSVAITAIVIIFQPEIRRMLERVGSGKVKELFVAETAAADVPAAIEETVKAYTSMSKDKVGALMVFERANLLDEVIKTGTALDCAVSSELLKNLFWNKAPLHDGAVIVRNGRIVGAGCMLPLSGNTNLSRDLGMRHRAGIGMSEHSDAVVAIVSEETGSISVAVGGMLKRHLAPETLDRLLRNELKTDEDDGEKKSDLFPLVAALFNRGKKEGTE